MAPSLMERVSAWTTRLEVRGRIRQLGAHNFGERLKAISDLREHMATDERVVPALLRALADDGDLVVRVGAADALARLGAVTVDAAVRRRAIDGLVEAFRADSAYAVRAQSAKTLHALGWAPQDQTERAVAAAMREDLAVLRQLIRDGHRDVVLAAVARELTDDHNPRVLGFIREVGAGSAVMVGAIERFVHEREQVLDRVAANLESLGISEPEARHSVEGPAAASVREGREVLAALRASVAAPNDSAHGTLRRVTGHSLFYKCPGCGVTLRKRDVEGVATALGWTSCSECAASFSYADVYYHGKYDVPEVEGACFACGASLRGPEADLAGKPCPSCGVMLPVASTMT